MNVFETRIFYKIFLTCIDTYHVIRVTKIKCDGETLGAQISRTEGRVPMRALLIIVMVFGGDDSGTIFNYNTNVAVNPERIL